MTDLDRRIEEETARLASEIYTSPSRLDTVVIRLAVKTGVIIATERELATIRAANSALLALADHQYHGER